jgi:polysaccharide pyruvyl transferase WcaK-like protein
MMPVIVAMEALDDTMCRDLIATMKNKAILISCKEYVGTQLGSILRRLHILTTTRYHAMVLAMPGSVPFIGLSRDERIRGVMKETGLFEKYYVEHKTPNLFEVLKGKSSMLLEKNENARVKKVIKENLPYYFAQMGMLGLDIRNLVRDEFPGITIADIDENDVTKLVPFIPPEIIPAAQQRFKMLRENTG